MPVLETHYDHSKGNTISPDRRLLSFSEAVWSGIATFLFVVLVFFTEPSILQSLDYILFYKPNFHFLIDAVHGARLPLWNPYIGLGRPFLADIQNAVFYPPLYLVAILGTDWGTFVLVYLHCLLAVWGMIMFSRALAVGKTESYLVAFSYLASSALTSRFFAGQILYCFAACYLPVVFLCAFKLPENFSARLAAIYSLLLALQFLCGHPQIFWISAVGQAIFVFVRELSGSFRTSMKAALTSLGKFCVPVLWSTGLVAVVLLPFLELAHHSNRDTASFKFSDYGRMEWSGFLCLFIGPQSNYDSSWETNYYSGLMLLFPGLAGFCHFRDRNVRALFGVAIVSALISLGANTPLFKCLYYLLPGIASFRLHSRILILLVFALLVSAGIWLSKFRGVFMPNDGANGDENAPARSPVLPLLEERGRMRAGHAHDIFEAEKPARALLFVVGPIVALLIALSLLNKNVPLAGVSKLQAAVLLCGAFLFACLFAVLKRRDSHAFRLCFWALAISQVIDLSTANLKLKGQYSLYAVLKRSGEYPYQSAVVKALNQAHLMDASLPPPRVAVPASVVPVNYGMIHGYSHFDAYTSLFLRRPWEYLHRSLDLPSPTEKNTSISTRVYEQGSFPYHALSLVLGWDATNLCVLLRTNVEPRAFLVLESDQLRDRNALWNEFHRGHDIHRTALVEQPTARAATLRSADSTENAKVTFVRFTPNNILLDVETKENALLVLTEAWHPGWKAKVGETVVPAIAANGWMRAFRMPAGKHRVEVFFSQNYLLLGGMITLLSAGLLTMALWRRPRNRREV